MKKGSLLLVHTCVFCCFGGVCLFPADGPRLIAPPKEGQSSPTRSTYESLTEARGTPKRLKEEKAQRDAAQAAKEQAQKEEAKSDVRSEAEGPIINFNNVNITEVLKYASRLTGKNFLYDPQELQFTITMISDTPSSVDEIMAMLVQSLRAHGYTVTEEGDTFVIHTNANVRAAGALDKDGTSGAQIATQVFSLQNLDPAQCAAVIKTMVSDGAIVEAAGGSRVVVSDVIENLNRISDILKKMDAQPEGIEVGQYVCVNSPPATLVALSERILGPLASSKPFVLVPHAASNSVFIVTTPFMIEKSLSIMQTIDLNLSRSGSLDQRKFDPDASERALRRKALEESRARTAGREGPGAAGGPGAGETPGEEPGEFITDDEVRDYLRERGLSGREIDQASLSEAREALRQRRRAQFLESDMPVGSVEATQFKIYRLQYRKSADVAAALKAIADSLVSGSQGGKTTAPGQPLSPELAQSDLIATLNSVQAVDDNNTIVLTGTAASLKKAYELTAQIDTAPRQVFIEALVLETDLNNSLNFGVEWAGKIQRTNFAADVGFIDPVASSSTGSFFTAFNNVQQLTPPQMLPPQLAGGLSAGTLGRKIKFAGKGFRSTGALIRALAADNETHIILNPKIVAEHNVPAEVFVGEQTPIKGQSIANSSIGSTSSVVATNYNTVETGVSLKVTPLISSHQTVTLIIEQKISSANQTQVASQGGSDQPPATVNETRTVTRVHMPSDHFLVMSGLIKEQVQLTANRIPCLGALPLVGTLFGAKLTQSQKRNIIIFIRPIIIDSEVDDITKRQEEDFKRKCDVQEQGVAKDVDDLRNLLNLQPNFYTR